MVRLVLILLNVLCLIIFTFDALSVLNVIAILFLIITADE